jgi:hypothetical protein
MGQRDNNRRAEDTVRIAGDSGRSAVEMRFIPIESKEILLNKEAIAVNQDPLGNQEKKVTPFGNDTSV